MVITLEQIDRLRRMFAEPTQDTYSDASLETYLTRYPLPDDDGELTLPDFNQAAADVWEEKAAAFAADFDFSADGGQYSRSQVHQQMLAIARGFRARRAGGVLVLKAQPRPEGAPGLMAWLGNAPEDDD